MSSLVTVRHYLLKSLSTMSSTTASPRPPRRPNIPAGWASNMRISFRGGLSSELSIAKQVYSPMSGVVSIYASDFNSCLTLARREHSRQSALGSKYPYTQIDLACFIILMTQLSPSAVKCVSGQTFVGSRIMFDTHQRDS